MSLQKGFFKTQSSNPVLPPEEWELVAEFTNPGSYSQSFDWGRYKVIISGAGGAGGASASTHATSRNWANGGSAGEKQTITLLVPFGETKTITGVVGSGGGASYAEARKATSFTPAVYVATLGSIGTGYGNGTQGTRAVFYSSSVEDVSAAAGGSGGGSTSLVIDGVTSVAKGGNGGACRADQVSARSGGIGGSGGVSNGTGAAGGSGAYYRTGGGYSGAGTAGYVRVYKSNLKPEPI